MESRGSCHRCSADLWVLPIICPECEQGFCMECIVEEVGICVGCCKRQRDVEANRVQCCTCNAWGNIRNCLCGTPLTECVDHVGRCKKCNEEICYDCRDI